MQRRIATSGGTHESAVARLCVIACVICALLLGVAALRTASAADDAAVGEGRHSLALVPLGKAGDRGADPVGKDGRVFGARNHVPAFFGEDLPGDRVTVGHHLAVKAAFPDAKVDLTQVGLDLRAKAKGLGQRGGGLHGAAQSGDVNGVDALGREPRADPECFQLSLRGQGRIAVAVDEREGDAIHVRSRLPVPDQKEVDGVRRHLEPALRISTGHKPRILARSRPEPLQPEPT